jgi:hypothetical protein
MRSGGRMSDNVSIWKIDVEGAPPYRVSRNRLSEKSAARLAPITGLLVGSVRISKT